MAQRFRAKGEAAISELDRTLTEAAALVEKGAKSNISRHNRTGALEESITQRLKDAGTDHVSVGIGSNLDYAFFAEFGTRKMRGHFYLYFGLKDNQTEIKNMIQRSISDVMKVD